MYTPASTAAEFRFQGNQPKIQNAYNYKKQVITGIHGLPFDQQNDDKYWQTKQILPNILRPLGYGIKNAAIINEGVYNINPIAGTNNFGGSDISLASGTNPTNYSIVNTTDIEDRLRAHAVPANNPLSAEYAKNLAPDAQLDPNSVEGDPMINTFRSEQSILRNAQSQIYDESLMPADGEEGDQPSESLIYGRLRAGLVQAHRAMKSIDPHDIMRGMVIRNRNEAIRRGAAKESGEVYDEENKKEDLAAQAGIPRNTGNWNRKGGGGGAGGMGEGGSNSGNGKGDGGDDRGDRGGGAVSQTAYAHGTYLNQPSYQARNGGIGVNKNTKIGGAVMTQVETIDNQNSANRTNNINYNDYLPPGDILEDTIALGIVRPMVHQTSVNQQIPAAVKKKKSARTIPKAPSSMAREMALSMNTYTIPPTNVGVPNRMSTDVEQVQDYYPPATNLGYQGRPAEMEEMLLREQEVPTSSTIEFDGAIRELTNSTNPVERAFGTELMGSSNSYQYEAFNSVASLSNNQIAMEVDQSVNNVNRIGDTIGAVGDTIKKFSGKIKPSQGKKPTTDPSEVKLKQENTRLQKERDDSINEVEKQSKKIDLLISEKSKLATQIKDLERKLEDTRKSNSEASHAKEREYAIMLHMLTKKENEYETEMQELELSSSNLRTRVKGLEQSLQMGNEEFIRLMEFTSELRTTNAEQGRSLRELDAKHKSEIDALSDELASLGAQLREAHSQREIDIATINELHGEVERVSRELEMKKHYIPPEQIAPILSDYERVANELRTLRRQPAKEITVYRDSYVPSRYEGSGSIPSGKRGRDEIESNIKNSMDSTHMLAGFIPGDSLPVPTSNMSTTNQLSESNNLPNVLDKKEKMMKDTIALRDFAQNTIGGGAVSERYEQGVSAERREREQKAELRQLVARVGRLVDAGKRFGKKITPYTQEDIVKAYIDEINDSVTSSVLAGCTTEEIVGAVNAALEVSAIQFHSLEIGDRAIEATASYSKDGITATNRFGALRGSKGVQRAPLKKS